MSNLLINEPPLMVLPTLAAKIGLNEAIILQQIHYWLDPRGNKNLKEGKHWVYNSYKDWRKQFPFWSEITIRRIVISLEKTGLLVSSIKNKNPLDKTKWYTIDYSALSLVEGGLGRGDHFDRMEPIKMTNRRDQNDRIYNKDTETTTDITSSLNPSSEKFLSRVEKRKRGDDLLLKNNLDQSSNTATKNPNIGLKEPQPKPLKGFGAKADQNTPSSDAEPNTVDNNIQKMLQFWSESVGQGRGPIDLTPSRKNSFSRCLRDSFKGDIDGWKSHCLKIASSKFLMGETEHGFKASLDWCLKETTAQSILGGKYTLATRVIPKGSLVPTDTETTRAIEAAEEELLSSIRREEENTPFKEVLIKRIQFGFEGPECRSVLDHYGWERGGFSKLLETYISDMTFRASKQRGLTQESFDNISGHERRD